MTWIVFVEGEVTDCPARTEQERESILAKRDYYHPDLSVEFVDAEVARKAPEMLALLRQIAGSDPGRGWTDRARNLIADLESIEA